jgi:antirestriction protein ArdC
MARPTEETRPLYNRVTDAIIAQLEQGVLPWVQPWSVGWAGPVSRPLRHGGEPYRGINVLLLWSEAMSRGFASPTWMTFRQALELGAHVRRGERGATVVYANRIQRTETSDTGEELDRSIPFLKAYTVFNLEQIDDLPEQFAPMAQPTLSPENRIADADLFFRRTGADIRHGGGQAFYAISTDHVQMPPFECFDDPEAYYATLAHECVHWTRHPSRLNREFGRKRWGDEGYAQEELVAELGAAFLCADLDLALEPREDHASYIDHWLTVVKRDRQAIFTAAAHAQRACEWLQGLQV